MKPLPSEGQISACVLLPMTYLGPIAWFAAAASFPECFIDNQMAYRKQSYRNRCIIMSANGPMPLTIPVSPESRNQPGGLVPIDYSRAWQRIHWGAITSAYNRSPFFMYYKDYFESHYQGFEPDTLGTFNDTLNGIIFKLLKIKPPIRNLSEVEGTTSLQIDLRTAFHPKKPGFLPGEMMREYRQVFAERHPFQAEVSILDLLFNLGPEAGAYLQTHTALVTEILNTESKSIRPIVNNN